MSLAIPPFDYQSHGPFIVSFDMGDRLYATAHKTLSSSLLKFFDIHLPDDSNGCKRVVDARGMTIIGIDVAATIDNPVAVATQEALTALGALMPNCLHELENFEMDVRAIYVHFEGGT